MVVLMGVTGLVVNLFLATYGNYAIASYGISFRLVQFPELIIMGLSEGVVPLIAYNFVSNKTKMKDTIKVVIVSIVNYIYSLHDCRSCSRTFNCSII